MSKDPLFKIGIAGVVVVFLVYGAIITFSIWVIVKVMQHFGIV